MQGDLNDYESIVKAVKQADVVASTAMSRYISSFTALVYLTHAPHPHDHLGI